MSLVSLHSKLLHVQSTVVHALGRVRSLVVAVAEAGGRGLDAEVVSLVHTGWDVVDLVADNTHSAQSFRRCTADSGRALAIGRTGNHVVVAIALAPLGQHLDVLGHIDVRDELLRVRQDRSDR